MNDIEVEIKNLTEAIDFLEKFAAPHYHPDPRGRGKAGYMLSDSNIINDLRCQKSRIYNIASRLGIYKEHNGCEMCHPKEKNNGIFRECFDKRGI